VLLKKLPKISGLYKYKIRYYFLKDVYKRLRSVSVQAESADDAQREFEAITPAGIQVIDVYKIPA
jgi:hypothetical protein